MAHGLVVGLGRLGDCDGWEESDRLRVRKEGNSPEPVASCAVVLQSTPIHPCNHDMTRIVKKREREKEMYNTLQFQAPFQSSIKLTHNLLYMYLMT